MPDAFKSASSVTSVICDAGSRVEMEAACPSGLTLKMATLFDRRQPGTISIVASSMDAAKAAALRAQAIEAVGAALDAGRR